MALSRPALDLWGPIHFDCAPLSREARNEFQSMDSSGSSLVGDSVHADGGRQFRRHRRAGDAAGVDHLFAAAAAVPADVHRALHVRAALCREAAAVMSDAAEIDA